MAPKPLDKVLLHVVLGDLERFEFLRKEQVAKSCRVGGEAIAVAGFSSLLGATDLVDHVAGVVATACVAGGVAVHVALASAIAAASSSSIGVVGGTTTVAAATTTATTPLAAAALWGSSRKGSRVVGVWVMFSTDAIAPAICWGVATTSGFVISSGGDSVVDPHEVGVFSKLGDEFSRVMPLSLSCYRCERHEALLKGGVYPVGDLIQSLIEVPDGKSFSETSASIGPLPVAVAPSILVFGSLVGGCIG
jgi:hypothetical protein